MTEDDYMEHNHLNGGTYDFEDNDNEPSLIQEIIYALKANDNEALSDLSSNVPISKADDFIGYEFGLENWHPGHFPGAPEQAQRLFDDGIISEERYDALAKALKFSSEELVYLKSQAGNEARGEYGSAWFVGKLNEKDTTIFYVVSRTGHSWEGIRENFEGFYLTRACIYRVLGGDITALKLCMDRICAPRKDGPISFEVPNMESAFDTVQVMAAVMTAVAGGNITPSEANTLAGLIDTFRRTIETSDIDKRVTELEAVKR